MNSNVSKFLNNKKSKNNKVFKFFNKLLVCFILFIISLILMKTNPKFKDFISKNLNHNNISFAYLNNLYNKYFGSVLPSVNVNKTEPVFNEKLEYSSINKYFDGYKLSVSDSYLVPIIESGIVVFNGKMDNYGNVVIIEGKDGVNIWYGNLNNINVKLYDYVNIGEYIGDCNKELYLVFNKNKDFISFDEYFKN